MAEHAKSVFHNDAEGRKLIHATTKFALSLYQDLASSGPDNIFVSPSSISMALAMTYLGAKGNTAAQMKAGLHFGDVSDAELHRAFSDLREAFCNVDGKYILHTANGLFGQKSYKFLDKFLSETKKFYEAKLATVDFVQDRAAAVALINDWVDERTHQKIREIVPVSAVDHLTKLILVNAIYFKGDWDQMFEYHRTSDGDFHISATETVQVSMMFMMEKKFVFGVNKELNCKAIELPFVKKTVSMVIILPDQTTSLHAVESKLTADHLLNIQKEFDMRSNEVNLWLPRFKLEQTLELKDALAKLGVVDLFQAGVADLSGVDGSKELHVSKVIHKAFIEVNEEGSEAAAATAVVMVRECAMMNMPKFKADHPFLFFIRHNATNAILFLGRVMKP